MGLCVGSVHGQEALLKNRRRVVDDFACVLDRPPSFLLVGKVIGAGRVVQLVAAAAQVAEPGERLTKLREEGPLNRDVVGRSQVLLGQ